jgi:dTDP-4-amino-4,6-dideoxygalactose transaminase
MPTPIPFVDLAAQHRVLAPELEKKLAELLESSGFILGGELASFEREFAGYLGVAHGIGVSNGTAALQLACQALFEPGDEVVVPAHTFVASALGVTYAGCRPVFADVTDDCFAIDPARLERAIGPRTRGVIAVHLYGHPAPMDEVMAIARRHGLRVIEDAAQAHGATYRGRRVGGLGDVSCFSFYPSKNLGALGDAGFVATNDAATAERIRMLRHMGQRERYHHEILGRNERLDALQAAFLRVKLPHLERWNEARRAAAAAYGEALAGSGVRPPGVAADCTHVYHVYCVRHPARDRILRALEAEQIGCGVYYPTPVPLLPCYQELGAKPGDFPVAEQLARDALALPMFPEISREQIERVVRVVRSAL